MPSQRAFFLKTLKIRRIFDAENQTLMYVSYSTREISGSFQHSLSTVPLWRTAAWREPAAPQAQGGPQQERFAQF